MRGNEGRWLAPSATPWDDAGERSLGPAETLVMACHRDLHGCRHAGASPGERRTSSTHTSGTRARDVGPARSRATGGTGTTSGAGGAGPANAPSAWPPGPCPDPTACLRPIGRGPRSRRPRAKAWRVSPGQTGDRRRLPPAGSPGRSPCRPGHGAASRRPATRGPTRGATALGQGPAAQGGRDEATRAVGEPGPRRHRLRREGQVALLAPRPGEARRARDAGGVCGPYPEGLPPGTRHGEEPRGARQGARADGGSSRPEADKDAPGQGGPTARGQRAMLPAGAVPELAFRIRQGAVGGGVSTRST